LVFAHDPGPWTGRGSNTWLIEGTEPTLIDTGSGRPEHLAELAGRFEAALEPGSRLARVLVTHAHTDHAGGASALAARWPGCQFAKLPWPERDPRFPVAWTALADDEIVIAGDTALSVVHTPGHSPDHLCFFEPRSGTLFGGDLVMNGGTVVIPASHGGSLSQYLRSLQRVLELNPRRILPGHGPPIEQPASLLRAYLAHRLARERQIVDALRSRAMTVPELVAVVYAGLQPDLTGAAAESVLAHLAKLAEEDRARPERALDGQESLAVRWTTS
jgi:glyoxylase-like metal-dependent hydrolase (beta-lactamase superfamily II)